jgi:CHAT domain-containing protein
VVVGHRDLTTLPFAALRDRRTGRYLIEDHVLETSPSASAWLRSRENTRERRGSLLVVANPAVETAEPLRGAESEGRVVAARYGKASLLSGTAATREAVMAAVRGRNVLHFAGHAVVEPQRPELSALLLAATNDAGGAPLYGRDIDAATFSDVGLVILSACRGATGPLAPGAGALSLARSFLQAGVPTVIASVWAVEDGSASELMVRLHGGLLAGLDPARALQGAQLALLRHPDGALRSPHRWAGFSTTGSGVGLRDLGSRLR